MHVCIYICICIPVEDENAGSSASSVMSFE